MFRKKLTIILLISMLCSCKHQGKPVVLTENLPNQYHFAKSQPQKPIVIHDQTPLFTDPTLNQFISHAIAGKNHNIEQGYAKIREARAKLRVARADLAPQIDLNANVYREKLSRNTPILSNISQAPIPLYYTDYKGAFDASWEIDFFGYTRNKAAAARAQFQSSLDNQHDLAVSTTAEIAKLYTEFRVYQQRIIIANQTLRAINHTVKLVKLQQQAGNATDVDLMRIESEKSNIASTLPPLQAEEKARIAALAVVAGEYPENLLKQLQRNKGIPKINKQHLQIGLPSTLLLHRPDIRAAERQLAAAHADVKTAIANRYPHFQLVANLGAETVLPGTFFQLASRFWTLGPQVTLPIFNAGKLKNTVTQKEAARDAAFAAYQQAILQALSEVETSLIRYQRERIHQQTLLSTYEKLNKSYHLIQLQYQAGQVSLIEVLDSERQLYQAADQQIQSQGQVTLNLISLYKALGGDWT